MEENEKLHKIRVEIEKAKQEKQQAERNTQIDSAWCGYGTVFS